MASLYDRIPGYRAAVARETVGRDAAYLGLPRLLRGVDLAVRPLTLRDYLRLSVEASPFVAGGEPARDDVGFLLWHQQAFPVPDEDPRTFASRFDTLDLDLLCAACGEFVAQALADAPGGSGSGKGAYYGIAAMLIREFRHEYPGMTRDDVLDTPLEQLWQEHRAMNLAHNPNAVLFNASDRLKGDWLAEMSRRNAAAGTPSASARTPQKRARKRPRA